MNPHDTSFKLAFIGAGNMASALAAGAAGIACLEMLVKLGVRRENIWLCDLEGLVYNGPLDVSVSEVPDARIEKSTDVLVRITTTNICGSDCTDSATTTVSTTSGSDST